MVMREDAVAEFLRKFHEVKAYVAESEGCSHLELWQDTARPSVFFTCSHWTEEAALEAYRSSAFFSGLWPELKQLFAEKAQAWSVRVADRMGEPEIRFGKAAAILEEYLAGETFSGMAVICDENTRRLCLPVIEEALSGRPHTVIEIAAGEEHKEMVTAQNIWRTMFQHRLDRESLVVNLGGGVIGDMGGFCAAAFMRGIRYINVPTTLLSMIDASVGGKTGIDFDGMKNGVGVFRNPEVTVIDPVFLDTLPERQMRSGMAEAMKHGIINGAELYRSAMDILEGKAQVDAGWIERIVEVKRKIVSEDPGEKGLRRVLNLGHTIGHALESHFLKTSEALLHGEAVALGIVLENEMSVRYGIMQRATADRIRTDLLKYYQLPALDAGAGEQITKWIGRDKKNRTGYIHMVLARDFGDVERNFAVGEEKFKEAFSDILADMHRFLG